MAEPVTPDREALIAVVANATAKADGMPTPPHPNNVDWFYAPQIVDAVLPLLTDALDRARQQGRDEAAAAIDAQARRMPQGFREKLAIHSWPERQAWLCYAARLARGGPNRKDEE